MNLIRLNGAIFNTRILHTLLSKHKERYMIISFKLFQRYQKVRLDLTFSLAHENIDQCITYWNKGVNSNIF